MAPPPSPYDRAVLNRRLALLPAAVLVAVAVTGCSEQAAALRVGDVTVSRGDFEDQLDLLYENDELRDVVFQVLFQSPADRRQLRADDAPVGSYSQNYAQAMLTGQVWMLLSEEVLDREGAALSDDDRDAFEEELRDVLGEGGLDDIPDEQRADLVGGLAAFIEVNDGGDLESAFVSLGREADVDVNSRYGSWDSARLIVVSPDGPAPAPGGIDPATGVPTG